MNGELPWYIQVANKQKSFRMFNISKANYLSHIFTIYTDKIEISMDILNESAMAALRGGNYELAANTWINGYAFPDDEEDLNWIFEKAEALNRVAPDPSLCAILSMIALDYDGIVGPNRRQALNQCIAWCRVGLGIAPDHYFCNRHAGSAFYWLDQWDQAIPYYEKAVSLLPSPVLQIRLFVIQNRNLSLPDFASLEVNYHTQNAMEAYNAGVELAGLLSQYAKIPLAERQRLQQLKKSCYKTAYRLYHHTLAEEGGNPLNNDPHTFAMCCNNLSIEYRNLKQFDKAIAVASKGMEYSYFMYILQNRFSAYTEGGHFEEAVRDGERLIEDFSESMEITIYFNVLDNIIDCLMKLKNYHAALEWINASQESYYALDPSGGVASSDEAVRFFTNTFIQKAKAEEAMGIESDVATASVEMDNILEAMPDNPSILISRAHTFIDEENYVKALECLQYAIHFASKQDKVRSVQVALYNMGYIHTAKLRNEADGLESFEQSIALGNRDFWCLYWAVHCCYHLHENEKTIDYAVLALEALPNQEQVTNDIISEVYEHLGTAQFDLGQYDGAVKNLRTSLQYGHSITAENNLLAAERELKRNNTSELLNKLFGQ